MRDPRRITGLLLIVGGLLWALAATTDLDAAVVVPATLVLIGVVLLLRPSRDRSDPPSELATSTADDGPDHFTANDRGNGRR